MTDPWPLRSSLELGVLSTAVPCACLHVKHVLWEWGLNSLAESAELLVSELVRNTRSWLVANDMSVAFMSQERHECGTHVVTGRAPGGEKHPRPLTAT